MKRNYTHIILAAGLIFMAASTRIISAETHFYQFWPVTALGLFSGAVIKDKRIAFLFTLLAQFSSDLYFQLFTSTAGFYGIAQLFAYGATMLVTLLGTRMGQPRALKVFGFTAAASAIFFIVSNFGVWAAGWYGHSFAGLVKTYIVALPFYNRTSLTLFRNVLVGDFAFSGILFGLYFLLQRTFEAGLQKAKA